jgi:uncharacterized damage-inducible protein DinB
MPLRSPSRDFIRPARGFRSPEAAVFVASLDDLTRRMAENLAGLGPRELEWQPAPGRNSIGMLLAHCALVEAAWMGGAAIGETRVDFERIVGIGIDDDGMPAAPDARHPRALRGWRLPDYLALLVRSRTFVRRIAKRWTARELEQPLRREWRSQNRIQFYHRRWILYHLLEHLAGHYGQMLLLKQLMQAKAPARSKLVLRATVRTGRKARR